VPVLIAVMFFRPAWKASFLIMIAAMVVDLDHLWASPVYDAMRCSIGFHPLHGLLPILFYGVLCFVPKLRVLGIGLVIHMSLDSLDCMMTNGVWFV
jgi:hypothetical protein